MFLGTKRCLDFGPFRLIPPTRRLLRQGQVVPLPPKALEILLVLVENSGQLVEKEELFRRAWPGVSVEENNLAQSISALRKALGDRRGESQYIQTVPGYGYRFVSPAAEQKPANVPSLAVLPFQPLGTGRPAEQLLGVWFGTAVADAITTILSNSPGVLVRPTCAVAASIHAAEDLAAAARRLAVGALLTGHVRHSGEHVQLSVQLVRAEDGFATWGQTFQTSSDDLRLAEDRLSTDVAAAVAEVLMNVSGLADRQPDHRVWR